MRELDKNEIEAVSGGDEFGGLPPSPGNITRPEAIACTLAHIGNFDGFSDCIDRAETRFA